MAFDNRRTYICYNNRDLIRDGFIPSSIEKEYLPVDSFNLRRLANPPKGVSYVVGKDSDENIISVREVKKLLPAGRIKVEIDFSKVMRNAVSHPISPGSLVPGTIGGLVGGLGLSAMGFGGFTSGITEFTFHILESRTKINSPVIVTQEIIDNRILQFDGFPLSIFGIVKEHIEEMENEEKAQEYKKDHSQAKISTNGDGKIIAKIGLDFTQEQIDVIGKFKDGSWQGSLRKRIVGATDKDGLFGGRSNAEIKIVSDEGESGDDIENEVVLLGSQKQLFEKIVRDGRKLKFRGDNFDAVGGGSYPFEIGGFDGIDVTDRQIRINCSDISVGDVIYITYLITVGDRYLRQNIEHKGTIGQGNTIGVIGFMGAVASEVDAFDYQIRKWKVPLLPDGIEMKNIDEVTDDYVKDDDYKLTLDEFIAIDKDQRESEDFNIIGVVDEVEGWRLTEAILWRRQLKFFAADHRGILYIDFKNIFILFPRSSIRDQEWFIDYLKSLDFTFPTGNPDPADPVDEEGFPKLTYLPTDLQKNIEDNIDFRDLSGFSFDTSEIVNSLLFDREKIHYYKPFANALKNIGGYDSNNETTGVGIINLDLLPLVCSSIETTISTINIKGETVSRKFYDFTNFSIGACDLFNFNLNYYDLSYGVFDSVNAQPNKLFNCEESFDLSSSHYFSYSYDSLKEGPGAWYDRGFIEDEVFEWRPDGGNIESYWKVETPYYCGEFSRNSHVYIEKMGGNSLDNYSWIYVDTTPVVFHNISLDSNYTSQLSMMVFNDSNIHHGLSYHKIENTFFESQLSLIKTDKTKNHIRDIYPHTVNGQDVNEVYDHSENFIVGQNRILGDTPSYSFGTPITDEFFKVCRGDFSIADNFWNTFDMLSDLKPDGSSFILTFFQNSPKN